jgi:glycolate oxidase
MSDDDWNNTVPKGIREIFKLCVSLGGTISGEHGIGLVQKNYLSIAFNETQLRVMKEIKKVFDPNGILNPAKFFRIKLIASQISLLLFPYPFSLSQNKFLKEVD